jgi:isopenicillin N synthase-like dioxygenase
MSYAESRVIDRSAIPVIEAAALTRGDIAALRQCGLAMMRASREVGFFYIRDHGVPASVIEAADRAARAFFAQPIEVKQQCAINRHHHGFLRVGEAKMEDARHTDLKESFVWGLDLPEGDPARSANVFLGPTPWPADQPLLRAALKAYFDAMLDGARGVMRALALAFGQPADFFIQSCRHPIARGTIIYYPPQPPVMGREAFGVSPHTDYGVITLLWQDDVGGLEVKGRSGEWVTAHPIPGTLVVNVGDLLHRWTNGALLSNEHRVINRSGRERHSMAFFFDPDFDTVVDPAALCAPGDKPRYAPTTCGAYVLSRFDQSFVYRARDAASGKA